MQVHTGKSYWFITGTSSGLGNSIANTLLHSGENHVTGYSRKNTIAHPAFEHFTADLSDTDVANKIQFTAGEDPSLIVLINNAGSLGEIGYAGKLDPHIIAETYNLNCVTPHILSNTFIRNFQSLRCRKIIINISSGAATTAYDGWNIYCATKAALEMMSRCLAAEQQQMQEAERIKVFSIAPGVMDTEMQHRIRATDPQGFSRRQKFVDLKNNDQLYNPQQVAERLIEIAKGIYPDSETIQRIIL